MKTEEWDARSLIDLSGSYTQACALHAAVKLDLFTVLGDERLRSEAVAERIGGDARAVAMLLNALTAMGLVSRDDDGYGNTPVSRSLLSKESPQYLGHMLMHHHYLMDSWSRLDQAVTTGEPVRTRSLESDEKRLESFLMGMFNIASQLAPRIAAETDLSTRKHLLDLGGGPGTYAIHYCLQNPQLRATVFDRPTTRPFAEQTIERFDLAARVQFVAGDYLEEPVPGCYDVAWLSHVLHSEGPEACQSIVQKAVAALEPGGSIMIHDFILDDSMDGPLFPALFSLNMLLGTERGQAYSERQLMDMLSGAGVRDVRRLPFRGPTDSGIVAGDV